MEVKDIEIDWLRVRGNKRNIERSREGMEVKNIEIDWLRETKLDI